MRTVPVSNMRLYTAKVLREMDEPEAVYCYGEAVAVIVPYALFLEWQAKLQAAALFARDPLRFMDQHKPA